MLNTFEKGALLALLLVIILIIVALISATPIVKFISGKLEGKKMGDRIIAVTQYVFILVVMVVSTASLLSSSFNPFIYFRF